MTRSVGRTTHTPSGRCPALSSSGSPPLRSAVRLHAAGRAGWLAAGLPAVGWRRPGMERHATPQGHTPCPPAGAKGVEEGTWQPEWQLTQSTKCVHLLRRLLEVGAAVRRGSGQRPRAKAIIYTQARRGQLQCSHGRWLAVLACWGAAAG